MTASLTTFFRFEFEILFPFSELDYSVQCMCICMNSILNIIIIMMTDGLLVKCFLEVRLLLLKGKGSIPFATKLCMKMIINLKGKIKKQKFYTASK